MSRYTGPAYKKSRKLGFSCLENGKELARRPYAPGQHGQDRRKKSSDYGIQLNEKQKVRFMYGVSEKQFRRIFEQAGKLNSLTEDSLWIASAPKQDRMDLLKANPQLAQNWDEEYGDRINQLVFIGKNMNEEQIKRQFNDCLA